MLTNKQLEKLNTYLDHKRARQRVILYLVADGHTIADILRMDAKELKKLKVHGDLEIYVEEILSDLPKGKVFKYPGGTEFKTQDIYRIVRQATTRINGKPLKLADFVKYIQGS